MASARRPSPTRTRCRSGSAKLNCRTRARGPGCGRSVSRARARCGNGRVQGSGFRVQDPGRAARQRRSAPEPRTPNPEPRLAPSRAASAWRAWRPWRLRCCSCTWAWGRSARCGCCARAACAGRTAPWGWSRRRGASVRPVRPVREVQPVRNGAASPGTRAGPRPPGAGTTCALPPAAAPAPTGPRCCRRQEKKGSGPFCRNGPWGARHKRVLTPFSHGPAAGAAKKRAWSWAPGALPPEAAAAAA